MIVRTRAAILERDHFMRNLLRRTGWLKATGPVRLLRAVWMAAYAVAMGNGTHLAGHMAFNALLAIFPFLIFLGALAGVLGDADTAERFMRFMLRFMPPDVARTLNPSVTEVLTTRSSGLLTVSILGTLWVASGGIEALRLGLDEAYGVSEMRPLWQRRLQSLAFVVVGAFAMFFLSLLIILGPIIWHFLTDVLELSVEERIVWDLSRYGFAGAMVFGALLLLHRWLPNTKLRWLDILPGVAVTTVLWILAGSLFSVYLRNLGNYSITYGSLGGVIVTLVFFYISALIFLFGAQFNVAFCEMFRPEIGHLRGTPPGSPG